MKCLLPLPQCSNSFRWTLKETKTSGPKIKNEFMTTTLNIQGRKLHR